MRKKYEQVPAQGITAEEVLDLWKAGKLFVETERLSDEELLARCQQEALSYVSAIDDYATPEWRPHINKVWKSIVEDYMFEEGLVMKKGLMQGRLNKYIITNIVFHLHALDIYQCTALVDLHKKLEAVSERNNIYKGAIMYPLNKIQRLRLRELKEIYKSKMIDF